MLYVGWQDEKEVVVSRQCSESYTSSVTMQAYISTSGVPAPARASDGPIGLLRAYPAVMIWKENQR